MNTKLEQFRSDIRGKRVTVIGIGISNVPLISFLLDAGAIVCARDRKTRESIGSICDRIEEKGAKLILGENYLSDLDGDYIFKTPGIRFDLPEIAKAVRNGSILTSEMEVFFELCPAKIIGITGSDGKTTTTTLIFNILCEAGYKCHLGGNIGKPLLGEIESVEPEDIVVVELSSFQLHTMKHSPDVAVITNLSPNHLDYHTDYQEYIDAKCNIYKNRSDCRLVLNYENGDTRALGQSAECEVVYFGRHDECRVKESGGAIWLDGEKILEINQIKIPGHHNVENYMAAIGAIGNMVEADAVKKVALTFGGVEHRIELVREKDGVKYYNSSIDSSPNRTINTLSVFEKVILISGGKDKGIPYDAVGPAIREHAKALILIGKTGQVINDAVEKAGGGVPTYFCESYDEVVHLAQSLAAPGDVVLLSPASTSFDMFKNFEERGKLFKELVNKL